MKSFKTTSKSTYEIAEFNEGGSGVVVKTAGNPYCPPDMQVPPCGTRIEFALCEVKVGRRALFLDVDGDTVLDTSPVKEVQFV